MQTTQNKLSFFFSSLQSANISFRKVVKIDETKNCYSRHTACNAYFNTNDPVDNVALEQKNVVLIFTTFYCCFIIGHSQRVTYGYQSAVLA